MLTEYERVCNYIRFGEWGDTVTNDENGREIMRVSNGIDTLPDVAIYESGKYIDTVNVWDGIDFLFGREVLYVETLD
jgi:hypothetical protein